MSDSEVLTSLKVRPSLAGNGDKNPKRVTAALGSNFCSVCGSDKVIRAGRRRNNLLFGTHEQKQRWLPNIGGGAQCTCHVLHNDARRAQKGSRLRL
jgi:hypothetical protein